MMVDSALLHYGVGGVAGLDFLIDCKISLCHWAVIYVMVALAMTDKAAIIF